MSSQKTDITRYFTVTKRPPDIHPAKRRKISELQNPSLKTGSKIEENPTKIDEKSTKSLVTTSKLEENPPKIEEKSANILETAVSENGHVLCDLII